MTFDFEGVYINLDYDHKSRYTKLSILSDWDGGTEDSPSDVVERGEYEE